MGPMWIFGLELVESSLTYNLVLGNILSGPCPIFALVSCNLFVLYCFFLLGYLFIYFYM